MIPKILAGYPQEPSVVNVKLPDNYVITEKMQAANLPLCTHAVMKTNRICEDEQKSKQS